MNRKYRIFDYCWHIPHQWDMINALRQDCEFYYCLTVFRDWEENKRPVPPEVHFVTHYEPGKYDVAILHIDQSVLYHQQKRLVYEQLNEIITDIPKIVVNHGTPVYPEYFSMLGMSLSQEETEKHCIDFVRRLIGDNVMVVNSHTAASGKEWGFGIPIIHGLNSHEWFDLPKEPRAFTVLSTYGLDTYYNRKCMVDLSDLLEDHYGYLLHYAGLNVDVGKTPESYKDYLGRSLLYIDTSVRTPMNRARTEAFLSGCCIIQVEGAHDLERWAKDGENIILVPNDPAKIAKVIADLLHDGYQYALQIGQKGKEMAMREFSPERYRKDWLQLIEKVTK